MVLTGFFVFSALESARSNLYLFDQKDTIAPTGPNAMSDENYKRQNRADERSELLAAIRDGLEDLKAGRTKPAREALDSLAKRFEMDKPV